MWLSTRQRGSDKKMWLVALQEMQDLARSETIPRTKSQNILASAASVLAIPAPDFIQVQY